MGRASPCGCLCVLVSTLSLFLTSFGRTICLGVARILQEGSNPPYVITRRRPYHICAEYNRELAKDTPQKKFNYKNIVLVDRLPQIPLIRIPMQNKLRTSLVIDIAEERATRATLVTCARNDHPCSNSTASYTMDLIVDELAGGIKLASRLTVGDAEDVRTFYGCSTSDLRRGVTVRQGSFA